MQTENNTRLQRFLSRYKTLLSMLILAVLTTIALGANPFGSETVAPLDLLVAQPGWASLGLASLNDIVHWQRSDALDWVLPTWESLRGLIRNGEIPVWLHYAHGGMPGIQLLSLSALSPSFLLYCLAPTSALGWYLAVWSRVFIGMVGMYFFLSHRVGWFASLFGAVTFGLAGYNAAWIFWPQTLTIIWLPWLFWATDGWFRDRSPHWIAAISFCSAFMILGGFPSIAAFGFYIWALYTIVIASIEAKGFNATQLSKITRTLLPVGLGIIAGFLVCAFPIYSLWQFLSPIDLSYRNTTGSVLNLSILQFFWQPYAESPHPDIRPAAFFGRPALLLVVFATGYGLLRIRRSPLARYILLLSILGLIALGISAGLANDSLIKRLPVFKNNPWHRVLAVFDFFAAAVAAFSIHVLYSWYRGISFRSIQVLVFATLIATALVQYIDQVRYFRSLNAVVPNAWFYPLTPSLRYIKERIDPLNSVIADRSYLISGTLGPYGIREWFANGFKTNAEKELLSQTVKDPFATPTAARFRGSAIHLTSDIIPLFGVRFILASTIGKILKSNPGKKQQPCPPLTQNYQYQHIHLRKDLRLSELRLLLATYRAPAAPADLEVVLLADSNNVLIKQWHVDKKLVEDNSWISLPFTKSQQLHAGHYRIGLRKLASGKRGGKVSVWCQTVPQTSEEFVLVNNTRRNLAFKYEFMGISEKIDNYWTTHRFERQILLLERNDGRYGPYLAQSHEAKPSIFFPHAYTEVSSSYITLRAKAGMDGWLVLPVRLDENWEAVVNGTPTPIDYYHNVFPMVSVTAGTLEVTFRYKAIPALIGVAITLVGLLALITTFIMGEDRSRRNNSNEEATLI